MQFKLTIQDVSDISRLVWGKGMYNKTLEDILFPQFLARSMPKRRMWKSLRMTNGDWGGDEKCPLPQILRFTCSRLSLHSLNLLCLGWDHYFFTLSSLRRRTQLSSAKFYRNQLTQWALWLWLHHALREKHLRERSRSGHHYTKERSSNRINPRNWTKKAT